MNHFKAIIADIETEGSMSLIQLNVGTQNFSTIVLDNSESADYLFMGNEIKIMFKETEVIIDTNPIHTMSLRNRIQGVIEKIESTRLLSKLSIKTEIGIVTSIITRGSVERLQLNVGDDIFVLIKTNEIYLST